MWKRDALKANIKDINEVIEMFNRHENGIINALITGVNNARAERLNGSIQELKTIGRGYNNTQNFRIAILFFHANLDLIPHKKWQNQKYKKGKKEICACFGTESWINWVNAFSKPTRGGKANALIIWDKNFVIEHVLPLIEGEESRKIVEYTLANSNDSTFKNIIDSKNKVVINDKMYYYPINISAYIYVVDSDYEWLKSIVPESSWIYKPDCFNDDDMVGGNLLIPLLAPFD